jgi:hypothetical protein
MSQPWRIQAATFQMGLQSSLVREFQPITNEVKNEKDPH